jgi:hypothetical protein
MTEDQRFDRIEEKLDKLTDAVTKIVRVEEKLVANDRRVDRLEFRMDEQEDDMKKIADLARSNSGVAKVADKIFWLVVAGAVSFGFWMMRS